MSFDVGDVATLTYTVKVDGVLTDATVALSVTAPDGTVSTPAPTHAATGTYTADVAVSQAGTWRYRWVATGAATDAETGRFVGAAEEPARVTLPQARAHLNFDDDEHDDDTELQFYVDAANEWMAQAVTTLEPTPVQMGILELIRISWKSQRGPAAGDLEGDELGGRGFLGFAIPNAVREWIEPWAVGKIQGGTPAGSFPDAQCWPDPTDRWVW